MTPRISPPSPTTILSPRTKRKNIKKKSQQKRAGENVRVSLKKATYDLLGKAMTTAGVTSIDVVLQQVLEAKGPSLDKRPSRLDGTRRDTVPSRGFWCEVDQVAALKPYLCCPIHKKPFTSVSVDTRFVDGRLVMRCFRCATTTNKKKAKVGGLYFWRSSHVRIDPFRDVKQQSRATDQFAAAFVTAGLGYDHLASVCTAMGANPIPESRYRSVLAAVLSKVPKIFADQQPRWVEVLNAVNDTDVKFDGTFDRSRAAVWCAVFFMTDVLGLILHAETGDKRSLGVDSTELEFLLTEKGLRVLALMLDYQVRSLTHDEHSEITAFLKKHLPRKSLFSYWVNHFHDFWHKVPFHEFYICPV
jgi:hypothetical protein